MRWTKKLSNQVNRPVPPDPRGPVTLQRGPFTPDTAEYTVVVLGTPRGGTTMVAGVVKRCGLHIGDNLPVNLEDQDFVFKDIAHMSAAVEKRNAARPVWAFKYPRASDYIEKLLPKLRNPRIVMVWRDLLAAASRGVVTGATIEDSLMVAYRIQSKNLHVANTTSVPILHVSYEKAVRTPLQFTKVLAQFVGGMPPTDTRELLAFMKPGTYKSVD